MNMKFKITTWTLLLIMALYSCNTGASKSDTSARASADNFEIPGQTKETKPEISLERKIIKEGEIAFQTSNLNETESLIKKTVNEMGGYIAEDNVFSNEYRITHRMTVRIAADRFEELLTKISQSAEKIERKNMSALDVTEEYIDVEARIKTKKELESQYKDLLVKAKTVEDLLLIEKEIGTLQTEIESVEGRLRYLQDRVSLSSLTIEYYKLTTSSSGFFSKLGRATVTGWNWLLAFIIGLIHFWPFILLTGVILFFVFRFRNKKKNIAS
jgi:hypothetical protein